MGIESWIFKDRTNNLWRFYISKDNELVYSIMYGDGKWTKESTIDDDVVEYAIDIDEDEAIHIIYSTLNGILKYCKWDKGQWLGKNLYSFQGDGYRVSELNLIIVKGIMHIFFILHNLVEKDKSQIMHYNWNDKNNIETNIVYSITSSPNILKHYQVEVMGGNKFYLILATIENNQVNLKLCEYKEHTWSNPKRLYGIKGNDVEFFFIYNNRKVEILNVSKENSIYLLEHAAIGVDGKIVIKKICENNKEMKNPILYICNNSLCSLWQGNEEIQFSILKEEWDAPQKLNNSDDKEILVYNYSAGLSRKTLAKFKKIFGTQLPNLKLYLPEGIFDSSLIENYIETSNEVSENDEENNIQILLDNVSTLERVNRKLRDKIQELKAEINDKRRYIVDIEESHKKILNEKKDLEERCETLTASEMTSHNEMENIRQQLKRETDRIIELEYKLSRYNLRNREIERSLEETSKEKEQLQEELKKERSKSFVFKIFRRE